jgi:hypothetical protein
MLRSRCLTKDSRDVHVGRRLVEESERKRAQAVMSLKSSSEPDESGESRERAGSMTMIGNGREGRST